MSTSEVVGIYARLSKLRGRDESIATQLRLGRQLAEAKHPGCRIVEYRDPDASAESEDVYREDYEQLKADLLSGKLTQVVTSDQERLTRRPDELEHLITVFRAAGVGGFWGYRDGWTSVALGQAAGARYKGVGAKEYVEGIKVKVREKLDRNAERGLPAGGLNYGYRRYDDRGRPVVNELGERTLEVIGEEAEVVRWMAAEILAGRSLKDVTELLNERDVPRSHGGKRWYAGTVQQLLVSPVIAGLRIHRGEIVGRGNWEPIIDEATHRQLLARLRNTRRSPRRTRLRYLLSGIAFCARCDAKLSGNRVTNTRTYYRCGICGVGISAELLERQVTAEVLPRLDALAELLGLGRDHEEQRKRILSELREIRTDRVLYGERMGRRELDFETYASLRDTLAEREAALSTELANLPASEEDVSPHAAREGLVGLPVEKQRRLLERYLHQVRVSPHPAGVSRKVYRPDRVRILTRVTTAAAAEAVSELTEGRRTYRGRVTANPEQIDLGMAYRFVEIAEIDPDVAAAEYRAVLEEVEAAEVTQAEAEAMGPEYGEAWRRAAARSETGRPT